MLATGTTALSPIRYFPSHVAPFAALLQSFVQLCCELGLEMDDL